MPTIFDNIETEFLENAAHNGLRDALKVARRGDFCVGYFNLRAKLYLAHRDDNFNPVLAFLGSSNLTMSGLRGQGELNVDVLDKDAGEKLVRWFEDRWADQRCLDITQELIAVIEESWAGERLLPPYHIYLKVAWHLSQDARDGMKEFRIPHDVAADVMSFQTKAFQLACRY